MPEHLSTDAREIIASLMQEKALWEQEKSALVAAHEAEKMRQMAELSRL